MPALYIGRFQPFHLGHLDAIRQIFEHESEIIIAIGSAQYSGTEANPYTFELRKKIIEASLQEAGILKTSNKKISILPLDDIHDDTKWCDHVDATLPSYEKIYTGSPMTKSLYEGQNKHQVITLDFRLPISSTEVRKKITSRESWRDLVPQACYEILAIQ